MDGITLASPVLRQSSKVTQLFCCHFLSSQPLQMNNFIFVRKLKYLEPLYLIIYKLYSICILFLIKGSTDALSSDNSFCDCTYNDLGLNELLLTSETQYHLLVIGGVEELPGPSSAKSAIKRYSFSSISSNYSFSSITNT